MSHYLSNIIAKTTGTADVVQPRPRSLYEPAAATAAPDIVEVQQQVTAVSPPVLPSDRQTTAVTQEAPTPTVEQTVPTPSKPVAKPLPKITETQSPPGAEKNPAMVTSSTPPEIPEITKPSEAEVVSSSDATTKRPSKDTATVEINMKSSPPNLPEIPQIKEPPPVPEMTPPQVKRLSNEQTESQPALIQLQTHSVVVQKTAVPAVEVTTGKRKETKRASESSVEVAHNQVIDTQIPELLTPQNKKGQLLDKQKTPSHSQSPGSKPSSISNLQKSHIVLNQIVPRITADETRPSFPEAVPSEPEIHVHIGRIEVRATPPPPQTTTKPQRKSPVMNLDDYLKQRNHQGGKA